jgi:hypothetical protein
MKTEIIEKLEALLQTADLTNVANEVRALHIAYENEVARETELARQAFMTEGGTTRDFKFLKQPDDLKLEELFRLYREQKKAQEKKLLLEQLRHQEAKQSIIEKIKALGNIQTQPGKALKTLKDLQIQWNEAGNVSSHVYKELQNEYSKSVEAFYYSLDIYKVMQDHDFKKNLELKTEIVTKLQTLIQNPNIKEIERLIKVYRDEWDEVGPVQNDKWDTLKLQWRAGLDLIYTKLKAHYQALEEQKEKNLALKNELLVKAMALLEEFPSDEEGWKKNTETLLALQKDWRSTGFTQKGKGEASWAKFREACDKFFESKNIFYTQIKEARSGLRKQKLDLIEKAEALSASTSWKDTSDKMIRLQAEWKTVPSTGLHEEPRLFYRFRKACNLFFDAKKKHFEDQDAASANECKQKEEILLRFQNLQLAGEVTADREMLNQYRAEWISGGPIPPRDRKRLNDLFYRHMDELYAKLNVNQDELALILFSNKLERLEREDSTGNLLQKEFDHIKKQAEQIHLDILKYENNLGFFKTTKGDNPLLSEIKNKIAAEKERHAQIKVRLKLAREALNRVIV